MATKTKKPNAGPGDWPDWVKNAMVGGAQGMSNINKGTEPIRYVIDALARGVQQAAANDRALLGRGSSRDNSVSTNPYDTNVIPALSGARNAKNTPNLGREIQDLLKALGLG